MQPVLFPCPRAEHAGARVTRNGSYGPYGRLRFKCQPVDGPTHTFSVVAAVPADRDAAPLKSFRHSAADIARALVHIGRGATYRQAAIHVGRGTAGARINGQLVANWVATFAPVVTAEPEPTRWPDVVAVGELPLRRGADRADLLVQLAIATGPAVLHVRVTERSPHDAWLGFFDRFGGRPVVIVADRSCRPAAAARHRWPENPPPVIAFPSPADQGWAQTKHPYTDILSTLRRCRDQLFRRLASRRAYFTNLNQVDHLVQLMRLDLNGAADRATYARRILARRSLV